MMSEDPTRAMPVDKTPPFDQNGPTHGRVGPADPHADPVTHPGLRRPSSFDGPGSGSFDGPGPGSFDGTDPVTDPGLPVVPAAPEKPAGPVQPAPAPKPAPTVTRTRTGGLWTGLILSAIVLIFLLVFILQNLDVVSVYFLGFTFSLPVGVALLLSAIAGLLLVAIPGGLRILQLRRVARRAGRGD